MCLMKTQHTQKKCLAPEGQVLPQWSIWIRKPELWGLTLIDPPLTWSLCWWLSPSLAQDLQGDPLETWPEGLTKTWMKAPELQIGGEHRGELRLDQLQWRSSRLCGAGATCTSLLGTPLAYLNFTPGKPWLKGKRGALCSASRLVSSPPECLSIDVAPT